MPTTPTILDRGDPILRKIAKAVAPEDITGKKIQSIIADMKSALETQEDGVAIAAPQIGHSLRIFVVSHKAFEKGTAKNSKKLEGDIVCINPELIKLSKNKKMVAEGCLSVRYLYGNVERSEKATVRALNEKGETFERGGSGLLAQIFQHETDHLNGILFTDKAKDVEDVPPAATVETTPSHA